jgi:hypothetical protein
MSRHDATTGTVQGDGEYRRLRKDSKYRRFVALMTKDKLVSLAEAVGAIPVENPEQGPWGASIHQSVDYLVAEIEAVLGIDISPSPIDGGLFKIHSTRAAFGERDLNALFTALSLKGILREVATPAICEIGGGSGRVAYWCSRLFSPSYTIIDLPHINVIQGYYLLRSLGQSSTVLYGEQASTLRGKILVLPQLRMSAFTSRVFDVVLNQDSFPEINAAVVIDYLNSIRQSARLLYSINHESRPESPAGGAQGNVPELVKRTGGFQLLSRSPYWLRKGYVAELYAVLW